MVDKPYLEQLIEVVENHETLMKAWLYGWAKGRENPTDEQLQRDTIKVGEDLMNSRDKLEALIKTIKEHLTRRKIRNDRMDRTEAKKAAAKSIKVVDRAEEVR